MIQLRTLGAVDLRTSQGGEADAVLRQPKRLAILAYLAADTPRRFHRRDSLLALFWPDLDEEHARAALRRSLHFLRQGLGPEVLESRGDEEVAVPERALPRTTPGGPLPAELPELTPRPAGERDLLKGREIQDEEGRRRFPLP